MEAEILNILRSPSKVLLFIGRSQVILYSLYRVCRKCWVWDFNKIYALYVLRRIVHAEYVYVRRVYV